MKDLSIYVAGENRTKVLEPVIAGDAQRRSLDPCCLFLDRSVNALSLAEARSSETYIDRLLHLVRHKNHVDVRVFDIPRRPGAIGAVLATFKKFLWKLLRYQHDRVVFRQNLINSQLTAIAEFQQEEIRKLTARVKELEQVRRS